MVDEILFGLNADLKKFSQTKRFAAPLGQIMKCANKHSPKPLFSASKIKQVVECANYLDYRPAKPYPILVDANFCDFRFCRTCALRRGRKLLNQLNECFKWIMAEYPEWCKAARYKNPFIFLTVTVPSGDILTSLNELQRLLRAVFQSRRFRDKRGIRGYFSSIEITYNPAAETYHPHAHLILAVDDTYWKDNYLNQKKFEWSDFVTGLYVGLFGSEKVPFNRLIGRKSLVVGVQRPYSKKPGSYRSMEALVKEAAKYSVKFDTVFLWSDMDYSGARLAELYPALINRQLCRFGGVFKDARKALHLTDHEKDLLDLNDDVVYSDISEQLIHYWYDWKMKKYVTDSKL